MVLTKTQIKLDRCFRDIFHPDIFQFHSVRLFKMISSPLVFFILSSIFIVSLQTPLKEASSNRKILQKLFRYIENDEKILTAIDSIREKISSKVYEAELVQIQTVNNGTFLAANTTENRRKCRYTKHMCYDHSRVRLKHDDNSSDFIDANYADGYKQQGKFIMTQGL
jgi:hypothetical protein